MTAGRRLVDALAAAAARYGPGDRAEKLSLLDALERTRLGAAGPLLRFHEALCFLQAYPDAPQVLAPVGRALAGGARPPAASPARPARPGPGAGARLYASGVAGAALDYPFGYPMARWLARRFRADAEIAWARFDEADRLDETLSLLPSPPP